MELYKNIINYSVSFEEKFVKGLNFFFKKWFMFLNDIIFNKDFFCIVLVKFYLKIENIKLINV